MAHSQIPTPVKDTSVVPDFDALLDGVAELPATTVPATEPAVTPASASAEKPQNKKGAGRPKKAISAPAKKVKKKSEVDLPKKVVGIHLTDEEHRKLKNAANNTGTNLSEYVASASADAMYYSYQCCEAACGTEFVLRTKNDGEPSTANCCPVCGSKQVVALKVL